MCEHLRIAESEKATFCLVAAFCVKLASIFTKPSEAKKAKPHRCTRSNRKGNCKCALLLSKWRLLCVVFLLLIAQKLRWSACLWALCCWCFFTQEPLTSHSLTTFILFENKKGKILTLLDLMFPGRKREKQRKNSMHTQQSWQHVN